MRRTSTLVTQLNFGAGIPSPRLIFEKMEDLHKERAERDKLLFDMGARFKAPYLSAHYNIDPAHIEVQEPPPSFTAPSPIQPFSRRENNETVSEFTARLEKAGQDTIDDIIDEFQAELDKSKTYDPKLQ